MLRKQTRRSFTVETKRGAHQGRAIITAKAPRIPRKVARSAPNAFSLALPEPDATAVVETAKGVESRRILPSLVIWEPSEPEPAAALPSEPPLQPVRRVDSLAALKAPRPRGRPRKVTLEALDAAPIILEAEPRAPVPVLASPSQARPVRSDRSETAGLPRGERWKRRLPRACW